MDNFVMLTAGDLIDNTLGVKFGLATLTAAACGQVVRSSSSLLFCQIALPWSPSDCCTGSAPLGYSVPYYLSCSGYNPSTSPTVSLSRLLNFSSGKSMYNARGRDCSINSRNKGNQPWGNKCRYKSCNWRATYRLHEKVCTCFFFIFDETVIDRERQQ